MARRNYNEDPSDQVHCVDGRLLLHAPSANDPYYQADVGKCDECGGEGCLVPEEECPGHVASRLDAKVCARCGIHIDSLRADEDDAHRS